jgi:hypothetical protein
VRNRFSLMDKAFHARVLRRWRTAAQNARDADLELLQQQRSQARKLKMHLDELTHVAEDRLALPRIGSNTFKRPGGTLWAWRPKVWRGALDTKGIAAVESKKQLGDEVTLFHDCTISELTLRQIRNTRENDLAPYGLRMDVFKFDGSFLSLVIDCPQDAVTGLQRRHLIRLETLIETEKPIEIFARLNIKHGPNTEQIVIELPTNKTEILTEFDLAYSSINEKRVEKMWVDLIFEGPEMNEVTVRDLTLCRYPRADF